MSGNNSTTQTGSASTGTSVGTGLGLNYSGTAGTSQGVTGSLGSSLNQGVSWGENVGGNVGQSASLTNGVSVGQSLTATQGVGTSYSQSFGQSLGLSNGVSQTLGQSLSTGQSSGLSTGQSFSESVGRGQTLSASTGESLSASRSLSTSQGESFSQAQSLSASQSVSRTETAGVSQGVAANRGLSDAYSVAASRAVSQTSSLGAVPSVGVSVSRNVFDERKRMIGDVLEMQAARYLQGLEGGGFFYQLFLLCPDSDTLAAATALLKSAFWGPSAVASSVPQPFHTISDFEPDEAARLLEHAKAFTHYRKREVNSELVEPHLFSTFTTCFEVAAMSHPPTAEAFGLLAVHDSMPVMAMPSDRQDRDLKLGYVVNGERGKVSNVGFGVDVDELTHTLIAGSTGSGKALALDTPIPTPSGWTTMGELRVGDTLFDDEGKRCTVTFTTDVMDDHECFRVTFNDGSSIVADAGHLWQVSPDANRRIGERAAAGPGKSERWAEQARVSRLVAEVAAGQLVTIAEAAALLHLPENAIRKFMKDAHCTPAERQRRTMVQRYDTGEVTKGRFVSVYRLEDVAFAAAAGLEARAVRAARGPVEVLATTAELAARVTSERSCVAVRVAGALDTDRCDLPIDPYLLGVWLGDGSSTSARVFVHLDDVETIEQVRAAGYDVRWDRDITWTVIDRRWGRALDEARTLVEAGGYTITAAARLAGADPMTVKHRSRTGNWTLPAGRGLSSKGCVRPPKAAKLHTHLRSLGLLGNKHIPAAYLRSSFEQRLALLQGLIDADGYVKKTGSVVFEVRNETLARDTLELVRSLGIVARFNEGRAWLNGSDVGPTWSVSFASTLPVARLRRKAARLPDVVRSTNAWRYITSVEPVGSVPVRCIEVSSTSHLFLAGEAMVPTHNTTTLMTLLSELTTVERTVVTREDPTSPQVEVKQVKAGIVGLDWMSNMRDLASVVEPDRFRFYSIARPELGAFRWNPLAVPDPRMNPMEWANDIADQMTIAFNLAEFGRSLVAEFIGELYTANRLEPYALCSELTDALNNVIRPAIWLEPIDRSTLPPNSTMRTQDGVEVANVISCPELSRLLSMEHLATIVAAKVEEAATPEGARLMGQSMRDRLQSLWRRVSYFAPGSPYAGILACDETLDERTTVAVPDLIDPDKGIVAIIEADGLDQTNRKFILGAVLLAIWRYGQFQGVGALNHDGQGPGTWVVLEEAHELFGPQGEEEDNFTAATRSSLYESLFRRSRALGMKLVAVVQNAGSVPTAVTSNVSTVFVHRQYDEADRKRVFNLLNWNNQVGQQQREWRYLGEMAMGFCIARLDAKESWLESAPIHFRTELAALSKVSDTYLRSLAERRRSQHRP